MLKPSPADLEMLAAVDRMFPKLREFLQGRLDDYVITMIQAPDGINLRQAGRAAELMDLIKLLEQARATR